jgi:hypothetical protein
LIGIVLGCFVWQDAPASGRSDVAMSVERVLCVEPLLYRLATASVGNT